MVFDRKGKSCFSVNLLFVRDPSAPSSGKQKDIRYDDDADAAEQAVGQGNPHLHSTQKREWGESRLTRGQEPSGWGSGQSRVSSLGDPIRKDDGGKRRDNTSKSAEKKR